jgi:steroid delta-isomerase-like uncharacterized protein
MSAADNERIVRRYLEAFNARDWAAHSDLLAEDVVMEVPGTGERHEGREAVTASERAWTDAFADGRIDIDHLAAGGDTVVAEYTGTGTHTGPLGGPEGEIAATGRHGSLKLCDVFVIRDGRIAEVREYFDTLALLTQLGLMPAAV